MTAWEGRETVGRVYGVIHLTPPVGWLPVHRDQLRAQRSVTSVGKLCLYLLGLATIAWHCALPLTCTPDCNQQRLFICRFFMFHYADVVKQTIPVIIGADSARTGDANKSLPTLKRYNFSNFRSGRIHRMGPHLFENSKKNILFFLFFFNNYGASPQSSLWIPSVPLTTIRTSSRQWYSF